MNIVAPPELKSISTQMIIGNQRPMADSGELINVEDPADGSIIAQVGAGGALEVDRAVKAARHALENPIWARMRPIDRGRILTNIARKLEEHKDELAMLESYDTGKAVAHAHLLDLPASIDVFEYMAGWCTKLHGKTNPISADGRRYHSYTRLEPVGVAGLIVPWNYPLALAAWKVAAGLAAGCTVVLKPSEVTPLSAIRLAELALEAGLPEGVFNVVTGYGNKAGQALVEHPGVNKISFTGSTRVGRTIVASAANDLKRVTLELGGKSPSLVFADADLDQAGPGAALAVFFNSGQICIAASRLYVEWSAYEKVLEHVIKAAESFPVGNGRNKNTMIGPLVSKAQQERVLGYIENGLSEGGEVVAGGTRHGDKGYFVKPTVFANTNPNAKIVKEEIFGPVLVATPFRDLDEAVKQANDTSYGLAANIWTRDLSRAHLVAERLQAGNVWVNAHGVADVSAPFGGFKQSGWGREVAEDGVRAYTETKSVTMCLGN